MFFQESNTKMICVGFGEWPTHLLTKVQRSENVNDYSDKEKKSVLWFQRIKSKCLMQKQCTISAVHEAEPSSTSTLSCIFYSISIRVYVFIDIFFSHLCVGLDSMLSENISFVCINFLTVFFFYITAQSYHLVCKQTAVSPPASH